MSDLGYIADDGVERSTHRLLSEADLQDIIDRLQCRTCKFTPEQVDALKSFSNNVTNTQKIATKLIIYGLVATVISFVGSGVIMGMKNAIAVALSTMPVK